MKHVKPETPLERADRMIAELQDDGERNGQHRAGMVYVNVMPDLHGRFSVTLPMPDALSIMTENIRRAFAYYPSIKSLKDWS